MRVHRSNRVERLFDALADVVREPLSDPLLPECIVVQSRGMNTWLSMQLARRLGVWAGGQFPFPRRFIDDLFATVNPQPPAWRDPQQLLWPILAELPLHLATDPFAELSRFVAADPARNLFQLAGRIASVFDQYPVFRPELMQGWDRGNDDHWQAILWRAIGERVGANHVAAQAKAFIEALQRGGVQDLPERVCVFGVSTLPPIYLHVLEALDREIPVHLFIVSASAEYWADAHPRAEEPVAIPPLLTALGGVGREFQGVLEQIDYAESDGSLYVDPGTQTMLTAVQSHLLSLGLPPEGPHPIDAADRSLAVHACHSPMREVEVLHDHLLDMLATDPSLQPRDVAVLVTDVETYAPLVEAVFELEEDDPRLIPYCVADRAVRAENPLVEAFHRVLAMVGGRVSASEVLDLLALEPVQTRFEIGPEEIDTVGAWVDEAGIRWGIDAEHRKSLAQPALDENTWRFGLHRLFLGFAMPTRGLETFADVLPYDEIEGSAASLLGRFSALCEAVFHAVRELATPRTPRQWQHALGRLLDDLLVHPKDPSRWEAGPLRTAMDTIATEAEAAAFESPIELEAMLELLDARLEAEAPPRGFLARGVTFCAMLPMRSVPFRVVCVLGLSDGAFPRGSRKLSFDLMAQDPRPGDRSRRADDRYLFLEAMLAARERVHLSYVGQSIADNSALPPSVVLADFLEQVDVSLQAPTDIPPSEFIRVRHPMQPFSPRYFGTDDDPRLFSFSHEYREGARALVGGTAVRERPALLTAPLPDPREGQTKTQLPLHRLIRFYKAPVADLVKRRLGVFLEERHRDYSDREPMEFDGLGNWKLTDAVLAHRLEALKSDRSFELTRAAGVLPLGTAGSSKHEIIARLVEPLLDAAAKVRNAEPLDHLEFDLDFGDTRLVGSLDLRWPAARSVVTASAVAAKVQLQTWIEHLCLCVAAPQDQEIRTLVIGPGKQSMRGSADSRAFTAVPNAAEHLRDLIDLFWLGQCEPLLLFPRTSMRFADVLRDTGDPFQAMEAARKSWSGHINFERDDAHLQRLAADEDVLDPRYTPFEIPLRTGDFATVASRVFDPMLEALG